MSYNYFKIGIQFKKSLQRTAHHYILHNLYISLIKKVTRAKVRIIRITASEQRRPRLCLPS